MCIPGMLMAMEARPPSSSQPTGSMHTGTPEQGLGFPYPAPIFSPHTLHLGLPCFQSMRVIKRCELSGAGNA